MQALKRPVVHLLGDDSDEGESPLLALPKRRRLQSVKREAPGSSHALHAAQRLGPPAAGVVVDLTADESPQAAAAAKHDWDAPFQQQSGRHASPAQRQVQQQQPEQPKQQQQQQQQQRRPWDAEQQPWEQPKQQVKEEVHPADDGWLLGMLDAVEDQQGWNLPPAPQQPQEPQQLPPVDPLRPVPPPAHPPQQQPQEQGGAPAHVDGSGRQADAGRHEPQRLRLLRLQQEQLRQRLQQGSSGQRGGSPQSALPRLQKLLQVRGQGEEHPPAARWGGPAEPSPGAQQRQAVQQQMQLPVVLLDDDSDGGEGAAEEGLPPVELLLLPPPWDIMQHIMQQEGQAPGLQQQQQQPMAAPAAAAEPFGRWQAHGRRGPRQGPAARRAAAAAAAVGAGPQDRRVPWGAALEWIMQADVVLEEEEDMGFLLPAAPGEAGGAAAAAAAAGAYGQHPAAMAAAAAVGVERGHGRGMADIQGSTAATRRAGAAPTTPAAPAPALPAAADSQAGGEPLSCLICCEEGPQVLGLGCPGGHSFCGTCLAGWLTSGEPEALMDPKANLPHCPSCKGGDTPGHISLQVIQLLVWDGYLTREDEARFHKQYIRLTTQDTIYTCITPGCDTPFMIDPPDNPEAVDAFRVRCSSCSTEQCAACGVPWGPHSGMSCGAYKASQAPMDDATKAALKDIITCPGKCGQGIEKLSGCNVLLCVPCRQYVCALCGEGLDSSKFDAKNIGHHPTANKHYQAKGTPCYGAMFKDKKEWLREQGKAPPDEAAPKSQPPPRQQQQYRGRGGGRGRKGLPAPPEAAAAAAAAMADRIAAAAAAIAAADLARAAAPAAAAPRARVARGRKMRRPQQPQLQAAAAEAAAIAVAAAEAAQAQARAAAEAARVHQRAAAELELEEVRRNRHKQQQRLEAQRVRLQALAAAREARRQQHQQQQQRQAAADQRRQQQQQQQQARLSALQGPPGPLPQQQLQQPPPPPFVADGVRRQRAAEPLLLHAPRAAARRRPGPAAAGAAAAAAAAAALGPVGGRAAVPLVVLE